jgi:SAM-dependent methyltransferase
MVTPSRSADASDSLARTVNDSLRLRAKTARAAIESGALRGGALVELILSIPFVDRDVWIDELLGFPAPPPDAPLPRGSVPYLPCGVNEIMAMVREVPLGPDDELVDLGSGLGRVAIIAHLLSGARARGVEIQEHLVHAARARCAALALTRVSFIHANAAELELDGSLFFLYAPFNGEMLRSVLRRVEAVARRRRAIIVCAVGLELHDVPWLVPRRRANVALSVYDALTPALR